LQQGEGSSVGDPGKGLIVPNGEEQGDHFWGFQGMVGDGMMRKVYQNLGMMSFDW